MKKIIIIIILIFLFVSCKKETRFETNDTYELNKQVDALKTENIELLKRIEKLKQENEQSSLIKESKIEENMENTHSNKFYLSGSNSQLLGYCYYIGESLPKIYPDDSAAEIAVDTPLLPDSDDFVVEVIQSIVCNAEGWYLVRVPICENYVFVKPKDLIQINEEDYPVIPVSDFYINNVKIGQDVDKLISTYEGQARYYFDYSGGAIYDLYDTSKSKRSPSSECTIGVDIFKRITSIHISSSQLILDDQISVGDTYQNVVDIYDLKYPRYEYNYDRKNKYLAYDTGVYILSFFFKEENIDANSLVYSISVFTGGPVEY